MPSVALVVLRSIFVMVAVGVGVALINANILPPDPAWIPFVVIATSLLLSGGVIALDIALRRKRVETISAVYFGLVVGLFLTYVVRVALTPLLPPNPETVRWVEVAVGGIGALLCYTCISLLIQTKDDFRFIIPYVEFSKEVKGRQPYVLDTSVMIDGRIADVVETDILDSQLIMPRFAIAELQGIADSSDKMRRSRGRRGLDVLNRLRGQSQS